VNRIYQWFKNKLGRLITAAGSLLAVADLDISPIQGNLEAFLSHKQVQALTVVLFLASYFRHQFVASKHPAPTVLPPRTPESSR
jgi:hypothetical protein